MSTSATDGASPAKNLAFAAASLGVAFAVFRTIQKNDLLWDIQRDALPFAITQLCLWSLYALVAAGLLKTLGGRKPPLNNAVVAIRLFSIFYVFSILFGTLAYKASGENADTFYVVSIGAGLIMQAVYFPSVFITQNGIKTGMKVLFILLNLLLAAIRAITSAATVYPSGVAAIYPSPLHEHELIGPPLLGPVR